LLALWVTIAIFMTQRPYQKRPKAGTLLAQIKFKTRVVGEHIFSISKISGYFLLLLEF
jgi:hypothetical protein